MQEFVAPFLTNQFMFHALIAGIFVAIACGIVGTFMVLRGLAFIGDALAHGVLPGIAASILLGLPGILGATVGSLAMIGGIVLITQKTQLSSDTAIGLSFVGMLALGVVIVSRSGSFSGDLVRVLFGEILGVGWGDIWILLVSVFMLGLLTFLFRRPFMLLCFSQEQTQVSGFSVRLYHSIMLLMIALTVIVSFQSVGTLLVFGMLLGPAATSSLFSRRMSTMMLLAAGVGIVAVYLGLLLSYYFKFAAGAAITLVAIAIFFIALAIIRSLRLLRLVSAPERENISVAEEQAGERQHE
jgi:ABC-type Mn2+/Zn2+ transport system permease subunit